MLCAYAESKLFVMPSEGVEGMPTVLLEAMAAGLPVIATRIPGNIETTDANFAKLVAPGDAQQLACALLDLTSDPVSLRQMGEKAFFFARRFDTSNIATQVAEVFRLLSRRDDLLIGSKTVEL
jgi:glycosyltransferase involved in cell wall biosynthesis